MISLALIASLLAIARAQNTFTSLTVFGASYTDNGHPGGSQLPAPYFNGSYSDGPIFSETISRLLNIPLTAYGVGGAWIAPSLEYAGAATFYTSQQVSQHLAEVDSLNLGDAPLYLWWPGINPIKLAWQATVESGAWNSSTTMDQLQINARANAEAEISQARQILDAVEGATTVLMSIPPLEIVPQTIDQVKNNTQRDDQLVLLSDQTKLFNNGLREGADAGILFFDANELWRNITQAGELNATYPCLTVRGSEDLCAPCTGPDVVECDDADTRIYWDALHPTSVVHDQVGQALVDFLSSPNATSAASDTDLDSSAKRRFEL